MKIHIKDLYFAGSGGFLLVFRPDLQGISVIFSNFLFGKISGLQDFGQHSPGLNHGMGFFKASESEIYKDDTHTCQVPFLSTIHTVSGNLCRNACSTVQEFTART